MLVPIQRSTGVEFSFRSFLLILELAGLTGDAQQQVILPLRGRLATTGDSLGVTSREALLALVVETRVAAGIQQCTGKPPRQRIVWSKMSIVPRWRPFGLSEPDPWAGPMLLLPSREYPSGDAKTQGG